MIRGLVRVQGILASLCVGNQATPATVPGPGVPRRAENQLTYRSQGVNYSWTTAGRCCPLPTLFRVHLETSMAKRNACMGISSCDGILWHPRDSFSDIISCSPQDRRLQSALSPAPAHPGCRVSHVFPGGKTICHY